MRDMGIARPIRIRAGLTEAADRTKDDFRIESLEILIAQTEFGHHARCESLDHNVRLSHQVLGDRQTFGATEIKTQALLAAVVLHEHRTASRHDAVDAARDIAVREAFDLDDFGTVVGQCAGCRGAGNQCGEFEDPHPGERALRVGVIGRVKAHEDPVGAVAVGRHHAAKKPLTPWSVSFGSCAADHSSHRLRVKSVQVDRDVCHKPARRALAARNVPAETAAATNTVAKADMNAAVGVAAPVCADI